jgi:hypothetical protein
MPTLTPAYGRDYSSKALALADYDNGKDFVLNDITNPYDGCYISKRDVEEAKMTGVMIRYGNLRKQTPVD